MSQYLGPRDGKLYTFMNGEPFFALVRTKLLLLCVKLEREIEHCFPYHVI
jgi:hypothetical protein